METTNKIFSFDRNIDYKEWFTIVTSLTLPELKNLMVALNMELLGEDRITYIQYLIGLDISKLDDKYTIYSIVDYIKNVPQMDRPKAQLRYKPGDRVSYVIGKELKYGIVVRYDAYRVIICVIEVSIGFCRGYDGPGDYYYPKWDEELGIEVTRLKQFKNKVIKVQKDGIELYPIFTNKQPFESINSSDITW